ncbi:MAG TPA: thiamine-phosphate kinase [Burkholderiales bacterium]|nr:thiamine-phosphate kinase [Burkholderiales bacterium]
MALSEFEIIRRFFTHPARHAVLGVGDDAAIVRARRGAQLVVAADMLVEGRHFSRGARPEQLGHKALAVNLSDMAAMGAVPRWATLTIALPGVDARWLGSFMRGFMRLARRHGMDLVGGDTTRGPLNISVQIIGEVPAGRALRRDGARAGDDVWVSGALGDAALALAAVKRRITLTRGERARLEEKLHAPVPRVALGKTLRGIARSAIDVSDGLVADLGHICERSRVSASVQLDRIPASAVLKRHLARPAARAALLAGGDDYELVFTAGRAKRKAIDRLARRLRLKLTRIGKIVRRRGTPRVTVLDGSGRPVALGQTGYQHF